MIVDKYGNYVRKFNRRTTSPVGRIELTFL
jgi:hypothetical protein